MLLAANLEESSLKKSDHLSFDQLSKVEILHDTELSEELYTSLKKKYSVLFEVP